MGLFDRDPDKGPKENQRNTGADQAEGIDADLFDQLDVPDAPDRVSDSVPDVPETSPEAATGSASAPVANAVPDAVPDAQNEEASDAEPDTTPADSTDTGDSGDSGDSGDTDDDDTDDIDDGADSAEDDAVTPGTEAGTEDTEDRADADVPAAPAAKRDIYDVVGRARPQRIEPRRPEPEPEPEPEPALEPAADESATTAFSASEDPEFSGDETTENAEDYGNRDSSRDVRREPVPQSTASFDRDDSDTDSSDDQTTALLGTGAAAGAGVAVGAGAAGAAGAAQGESSTETTTFPAEDPTYPDYPAGGADADLDSDEAAAESGDGEPVGRVSTDDPRRGTLDFGLLILRLVAGALLIIRGLQTLFAFGGDPGISALEQTLNAYSFADILAVAIPVAQVVGGGLLVFGLLTPIGGAVSLVVAGFLALHSLSLWDSGYWPYALSPAVQMWGLVAAVSLVLIFTGPGRYSADISRGWATRPLASAWVFALIGLGATAGLWLAVGGGNPF